MSGISPIPENEMERILDLSEFDLDYSNLQNNFKDLTKLAAKVAGTEISLVNLIDSFTQWSVSSYGLLIEQMPREDSICQYTIVSKEYFEVKDLTADERFKNKGYVTGDPHLHYYFGVPLTTESGYNLGALCVLDKIGKEISPEKVELLKIIAGEIVNRLTAIRVIQNLRNKISEARETKKKVAHDIRGPLSGIVGLAQFVSEQGKSNKIEEVLELMTLIQKGGNSLLELTDEILSAEKKVLNKEQPLKSYELNLVQFKEMLKKLYTPQAMNKKILFTVNISGTTENIPFSKNKLLQITGNLVSNAIKFTPAEGKVTVNLDLVLGYPQNILHIVVTDSGVGLNQEHINCILQGNVSSTEGTSGEQGYGFGLALVKHLVDVLKGTMQIHSKPGEGTSFEITLAQS
ncbi:MAG: GAF domain-containing sensor histidine kinase [Sediminibacterium sp.]